MDIPVWIFLLIGVLVVLGAILKNLTPTESHSYTLLPVLLSPAERSFFGVLNQAVGASVTVFPKVRVADVLLPQKSANKSNWQRAFNRISSKHFDFVLCSKHDVSILCAIELNDRSHNSKKGQTRDSLLRSACESAQLPLIEVTAKRTYIVDEIRAQLALALQPAI